MGIRRITSVTLGDFAVYAAIAVALAVTALLIDQALGAFTADPDYAYLLNGLDILSLKPPTLVDHPGTTVQTIIAIVLGITWIFTLPCHGFSSVQDQVLLHPQFYMECVSVVFTAGIAAAMIFFAWSVRQSSGMLAPALVGLISIFQSSIVYLTFHRAIPECVLFAGTLVLAGFIAQAAYATDKSWATKRFAAAIGIVLGFCVVTKVTSAPLLLTLFFLPSWKARKIAIMACGAASVVLLLPILPRWHGMERNFVHILTHRGDYGRGEAGAPSVSDFLTNLGVLRDSVPEIIYALALCAVLLLGRTLFPRLLTRNLTRALLLCAAVFCAGLLMVAKQPHPYYLVPEMAFVCLVNTIGASLLLGFTGIPMWLRASSIALLFAILAVQAIRYESQFTRGDSTEAVAVGEAVTRDAQRGCQTVFYYSVNQTEFNLFFGNVTSGRKYSDRLARLYPDFMAYNTGSKLFETFNGELTQQAAFQRFSRQKCVDFLGSKWNEDYGIPGSSFRFIMHGGSAYLYAYAPS